jgi:hypothetical protein
MTYNRFLWNTALWNAGRDEVGAIARSIISAHTGPHVQAVVGGSGGTTLISDFTITEGTVTKPPTQYKFPDLSAFIRAYQTQAPRVDFLSIKDLAANLRGFGFKDMPACVFITNRIPDLPASIFGLFEANLLATIIGQLGQHDLPAIIQALVANLAAQMLGLAAPTLPATIFAQSPGNLGARIHTPADLGAIFQPVQFGDLPANILGFGFKDLPANMLGIPAPTLLAFLRAAIGDIKDMPARSSARDFGQLSATILSSLTAASFDVPAFVRIFVDDQNDLSAVINFIGRTGEFDLPAIIQFLGALGLPATITPAAVGERDRFLNSFIYAIRGNLGATLNAAPAAFLGANIRSLSDKRDLNATIRVSETFVTALLTISTLVGRDLRATIGRPECAGGSANSVLGAIAVTQHARNLGAFLESFLEKNLGASINTSDTFFAYDTIDIRFTPFKLPIDPRFSATDTIPVLFSPFRGQNLGASITSEQNNVSLGASIAAVFPIPRVVPAVNRLTAADLRINEPQNLQEIRLQLEGALLEYIYVNGTETSFIQDPNEAWKINIRSFRPIAAGLFGDRAAAKICRLGSLTEFHTMDEAVRFCIQEVLGFESQADFGATIAGTGGATNLNALLDIQNDFGDLNALANRVFLSDFGATVTGII